MTPIHPNGIQPRPRRIAFALYALFTLLAFPHELPGLGAFDLGLVSAWLGPAALVVALDGLSARRAAWRTFLASLLAHAVLFHWFIVVTVGYGGMPLALGLLSPLLPAYWVAQFSALFAGLWAGLARRRGAVWLGACAWVGLDWIRGSLFGGFPWATLGYALHLDLPLLGLTRLGGVYVLSFMAALVGLALGRLALDRLASRPGRPLRSLATIATGLVAAHLFGSGLAADAADAADGGRDGADPGGAVESVRIAAVQGDIDQGEKWDAARRERILATYLRLSDQAVAAGARWIVWPETAVPGSLEWDRVLRERIVGFARDRGVTLVVGGMGIAFTSGREGPSAYYDSAFVVDAEGRLRDRYDKVQLVPFGEFVPLRDWFGRFFQSLARGLSPDDVTAGPGVRAMSVPGTAERPEGFRVGVPICYELLFPDVVRRFVADGAGVLLAVTNDAWYGRTGAPHQFLAMTALRSAETARFTVRAANTGISAIIDARGRVLERSRLFEEAVLVADVPVVRSRSTAPGRAREGATFYVRHGDFFAWSCMLLALVGLVIERVTGRSSGGDPVSRG
ncbi:MAG: apolipoprotein N-acyltransferase [Myxococcota bacterium]